MYLTWILTVNFDFSPRTRHMHEMKVMIERYSQVPPIKTVQ